MSTHKINFVSKRLHARCREVSDFPNDAAAAGQLLVYAGWAGDTNALVQRSPAKGFLSSNSRGFLNSIDNCDTTERKQKYPQE